MNVHGKHSRSRISIKSTKNPTNEYLSGYKGGRKVKDYYRYTLCPIVIPKKNYILRSWDMLPLSNGV